MAKTSRIKKNDLSVLLNEGFMKARKKLIEEEKKKNGYLVVFRNGKVVKVPASEL
jgi:hypothetical protein